MKKLIRNIASAIGITLISSVASAASAACYSVYEYRYTYYGYYQRYLVTKCDNSGYYNYPYYNSYPYYDSYPSPRYDYRYHYPHYPRSGFYLHFGK